MKGLLLCSLLCLVSAAPQAQESAYAQAMQALEAKDFQGAWSHLERESDDFWQASGRALVLYAAGDFGGTLVRADEALALRAGDLDLLFRAAWAAVSLGDLARAEDYVERLGEALKANSFSAEHAAFWASTMDELRSRTQELQQAAKERVSVQGRARWVSLLGLFAVMALILGMGRGSAATETPTG